MCAHAHNKKENLILSDWASQVAVCWIKGSDQEQFMSELS